MHTSVDGLPGLTMAELTAHTDDQRASRGMSLFISGAVTATAALPTCVAGAVHGTTTYAVMIYRTPDGGLQHHCTCPDSEHPDGVLEGGRARRWGWLCKHAVAVAASYIASGHCTPKDPDHFLTAPF